MLQAHEQGPEVAGAERCRHDDGEELEKWDRQPPMVDDPVQSLVALCHERVEPEDLQKRLDIAPENLHLSEGEASQTRRQSFDCERDRRDGDPCRDGSDEHGGTLAPVTPVRGADRKTERAGDRGLQDESRGHRRGRRPTRGSKDCHDRGPRPLTGSERCERDYRQALESRAHKRYEPAEDFENQPEVP